MNWQTVQDTINTWFSKGTGLTNTFWMNQSNPRHEKPLGILQILNITQFGTDAASFAIDPMGIPGTDFIPTVTGQRSITVTCSVHAREQTANLDAIYYLERARAYSKLPNTLEALRAGGVALWDIGTTVVVDAAFDKRMESRAFFDVIFGVAESIEFSNPEDSNSYIERAEISADYSPGDGLDFDDDIFGVPV